MRLQRSLALLESALELPVDERQDFLRGAAQDDPELLREVTALLAAHASSDGFLEPPAAAPARQHIGPYELLECLGSGGMGMVYRARRRDGLYSKDVALKILREPSPDLARRLHREREIVGALAHPGIASLLDGGTDEHGVPYLVLEFVEGCALDQWIRQMQPDIDATLRLALQILDALAYAHARLVVHRDLKPHNILVDARGQAKLVDFGIARVISMDGTAQTALALTPAYAAPEQLRNAAPTALSDLYSFAVVLFEMLSGELPYPSSGTDLVSWVQTITEGEPRLASQVCTSRARSRELKGDIDAILLRALEKDPAARYQSAQEFAADISRHLDGFAVLARRPSVVLRAWKYARRHRALALGISATTLAVVMGSGLAVWQGIEARHERDQALRERSKAQAVSSFMQRMLSFNNPLVAEQRNAGATTIGEVLDEWGRRLGAGDFDNQPGVKAELLRVLSQSYESQGRYDLYRDYATQWAQLARQLSADDPTQLLLIDAQLALVSFAAQDLDRALGQFRAVLPALRAAHQRGGLSATQLIPVLNTFGYLRRTQGDSVEAEAVFRESLTLAATLPDGGFELTSTVRSTLASTLYDQGRMDDARAMARDAVAAFETQPRRMLSADYGFALTVHGGFLTESGELTLAGEQLSKAEALLRERLGAQHLWLGDALRNLGLLQLKNGQFEAAMIAATEAQAIYERGFGQRYDHYPTVLLIQAQIHAARGQPAAAEALFRRALAIRRESLPPGHYFIALAELAYAEFLLAAGRRVEAQTLLGQALSALTDAWGPQHPRTLEVAQLVSDSRF
jgi:tetratricopeptide (TPR) repeat protein